MNYFSPFCEAKDTLQIPHAKKKLPSMQICFVSRRSCEEEVTYTSYVQLSNNDLLTL